ncbi:MAG: CoA pyrophosphatase [Anaerolineae bacterium]|nr:CoA pyrophosphatase [Anaerolineae bacterium]
MVSLNLLTAKDIQDKLQASVDSINTAEVAKHLRQAAVLIPFLYTQDTWHLLFTRRTHTVQDHKGQVSFPGGGVEQGDVDIRATALRESHEEIGLYPRDVQILGFLPPLVTPSNYHISPVAGLIPAQYAFTPSPVEVDRIFTIPLDWLANPAHHQQKMRQHPDGRLSPVIYFDEYDGELLWGITASITLMLINLIS